MAYDIPSGEMAARVLRSSAKTPAAAIKAITTLAGYNTDSSIDNIANIARDFATNKKITKHALSTLAGIKGEVATTSIWKIARDVEGAKLAGLMFLAERTDDKATICIKEIGCTSDEKIALAALFYLDSRLGPDISDHIRDVGLRSHEAANVAFDILERRADIKSIRNICKLGLEIEGMERHAFQTLIGLGEYNYAATLIHNMVRKNPIQTLGIVLSNDFLKAQILDENQNFGYPCRKIVKDIFSTPEKLLEVVRGQKNGVTQLSTILARATDEKLDVRDMPFSLKEMKRRVSACEMFERKYSAQYQAFEKAFN